MTALELLREILGNDAVQTLTGVALGAYLANRQERRRRARDDREARHQRLVDAYSDWAGLVQTYYRHNVIAANYSRNDSPDSETRRLEHERWAHDAKAQIDSLEARLMLLDTSAARIAAVVHVSQLIAWWDSVAGWEEFLAEHRTMEDNPLWREAYEALKSLGEEIRRADAAEGTIGWRRLLRWPRSAQQALPRRTSPQRRNDDERQA
jgi:hypothetical protein